MDYRYRARAGAGAGAAILTSWSRAKMERLHNTACGANLCSVKFWILVQRSVQPLFFVISMHQCRGDGAKFFWLKPEPLRRVGFGSTNDKLTKLANY